MSRRMIDPSVVIKSQIVNDKEVVDLHEILEKYGVQTSNGKSSTLQFYNKEVDDGNFFGISSDTGDKGIVMLNTAITITKFSDGYVYINGLIFDMGQFLLQGITIPPEEYENGIMLMGLYEFDVHVIKV